MNAVDIWPATAYYIVVTTGRSFLKTYGPVVYEYGYQGTFSAFVCALKNTARRGPDISVAVLYSAVLRDGSPGTHAAGGIRSAGVTLSVLFSTTRSDRLETNRRMQIALNAILQPLFTNHQLLSIRIFVIYHIYLSETRPADGVTAQ